MTGESLGPYKILEPLGAGGMGEVYLGEDTRLGRKVAIKVLPPEFASDPERLARFEQEARAAAALNHPHIAVVHDVGSEAAEDGTTTHFMVQEYLEGQSLRERLEKGALPLDKTLDLAIEVGEALIAAHKAGIIHRDLKPDNVFVTDSGHAKVLDFGLAKLVEGAAPAGTEMSMSPTVLGTVAGQVMGTAGYMAPEQIQGDVEIDQRADLFAFGCVLYEMIAGKRAFGGETVLDTLHAIARSEPQPLGEIKPELPLELPRILKKCLAKEAGRRYQIADDLVVDLRQLQDDVAAGVAPSAAAAAQESMAPVAVGVSPKVLAAAVVGAVAIAIAATWFSTRPRQPEPLPVVEFDIELPEGVNFTSRGRNLVAVSPIGTHVVFNGNDQLWVRRMDQRQAIPLRGTEGGGRAPFFSPDGREVGFWVDGQLKKVPIDGGPALPLTAAINPDGATWLADGTIIYGQHGSGIWRVSGNGGPAELIVPIETGRAHGPQLLPGGDQLVMYTYRVGTSNWGDAQIVVQRLGSDTRKVVINAGRDARYVPTGHLVYARQQTLWATPFDLATLVAGDQVSIVEEVRVAGAPGASGTANYGFTNQGGLVYVEGAGGPNSETALVFYDREGAVTPLPFDARVGLANPRLSRDDTKVVAEVSDEDADGDTQIWIFEIASGRSQQLTFEGINRLPVWSPDGETVFYASTRGGGTDIYRRAANFTGDATPVLEEDDAVGLIPTDVSSAPHQIAYARWVGRDAHAWRLSLNGESPPEMISGRPGSVREMSVRFSPDGRFVAYSSNHSGRDGVYVMEVESEKNKVVSNGGGVSPIWSRDGTEIFFWRPVIREFFAADFIASGSEFTIGGQRRLFDSAPGFGPTDVTRDGQRFLGIMLSEGDDPDFNLEPVVPRITVILNWFELLKERARIGR